MRHFVINNAGSKLSFEDWWTKVKAANWVIPSDIKRTFGSVDLIGKGSNRAIFNIGGNNYRIICKYAFGTNEIHLFVCWIGTHAEYDKLCENGRQFTINIY